MPFANVRAFHIWEIFIGLDGMAMVFNGIQVLYPSIHPSTKRSMAPKHRSCLLSTRPLSPSLLVRASSLSIIFTFQKCQHWPLNFVPSCILFFIKVHTVQRSIYESFWTRLSRSRFLVNCTTHGAVQLFGQVAGTWCRRHFLSMQCQLFTFVFRCASIS